MKPFSHVANRYEAVFFDTLLHSTNEYHFLRLVAERKGLGAGAYESDVRDDLEALDHADNYDGMDVYWVHLVMEEHEINSEAWKFLEKLLEKALDEHHNKEYSSLAEAQKDNYYGV